MNKKEAIQEQIDNIMDTFDFHRVQQMMRAVGWTWALSDNKDGPPRGYELRETARRLLRDSVKDGTVALGGFKAECVDEVDEDGPWLRLSLQWGPSSLEDGGSYES